MASRFRRAPPPAPTPRLLPSLVSIGAVSVVGPSTVNTVPLPAGAAVGDLLLLLAQNFGPGVLGALSGAGGGTWTQDATHAATNCRLTAYWSRMVGGQTAPTLSALDADHTMGVILAIRDAVGTGSPFDVTGVGTTSTFAETSTLMPGPTTVTNECLVVIAAGLDGPDADGTASFTSFVNGNLANITEWADVSTSQGSGGSLGVVTGTKAIAGAVGDTTVTHVNQRLAGRVFAIKPASVGPAAYTLPALGGSYALTGAPVSIPLFAGPGVYALTGAAAALNPTSQGGFTVSVGAVVSGPNTPLTVPLPTAAAGDILLVFIETLGTDFPSLSNANGGTWAQESTHAQGGAANARFETWWSRHNGTQGAPTFAAPADHMIAVCVGVRGCKATGSPFNAVGGAAPTFAEGTTIVPALTTDTGNCLLVVGIGTAGPDLDGTNDFAASNPGVSLAERVDAVTSAGAGGGLGVYTGAVPSAGSTGATTITHSNFKLGYRALALAPVAVANTITASPGSYVLTGGAVNLGNPLKGIIAEPGTYVYSAPDATLEVARPADVGSYALQGADVTLRRGWYVVAQGGTYAISGQPAGVQRTFPLVAEAGSYVLTGTAMLWPTNFLPALPGTYSLLGGDVTLRTARRIVADPGSYVLTGADANLAAPTQGNTFFLVAEAGVYQLTGGAAQLVDVVPGVFVLAAEAGAYALVGSDAQIGRIGLAVVAAGGSYALTGGDVTFGRTYAVTAEAGLYSLRGGPVRFGGSHPSAGVGGGGSFYPIVRRRGRR